MRLLLINPNTTVAMTDQVLGMARQVVAPDTELLGVTARFGATVIASEASYAIAAHAALDAWARSAASVDAVVLACFGDPGLDALRELSAVPVVGLAEASIHAACQTGTRFGIVCGGARWAPMLRAFVAGRGLLGRLSGVHTVAPTGADIARDPDGSLDGLAKACQDAAEAGAEVVILGGAGLAGLAPRLAPKVAVPLIDCVVTAINQAEALARIRVGDTQVGPTAGPAPCDYVGLSPELAARLATPVHS
ncbi:MAG TPA: aspartate/glutamate racemase family protein [Vineibacter sp.]|nr:aspartate/glutamate racemase family protein [Vineibacter sp.]